MKAQIAARFALALLLVLLLASLGCGPRDFVLYNPQVCKSVDAKGNPKDPTTTFTTQDAEAILHFQYRNAPANTTITCKLVFTDAQGGRYTLPQNLDLTPGSHKGAFKLAMPQGQKLPPGSYEATLLRGDTQLGSPLTFTVASARGAPSPAPAPAASSRTKPGTAEERLAEEARRHGVTPP